MKRTLVITVLALGIVTALGLMAFTFADAAGMDIPALQIQDGPRFQETDKAGIGPYVEAAAAEILGVSVEELQEAREAGPEAMEALLDDAGLTPEEFKAELDAMLPEIVDAALADEAITEEQAEWILEHGLRRPGDHRDHRPYGPLTPYVLEATADALDMDVEELKEALQSGTTMDELLEEAGMTHRELRMAIDEATPDIVEQALEDGVIGDDAAEKILEYGLWPPRCRPERQDGPGRPGGPQGFGPNGFAPKTDVPGFIDFPTTDG